MDGYFVGNTIGDAGLSAINGPYPIEALIQALGTGWYGRLFGYSINAAEKKENGQKNLLLSWWLCNSSVISTIIISLFVQNFRIALEQMELY